MEKEQQVAHINAEMLQPTTQTTDHPQTPRG